MLQIADSHQGKMLHDAAFLLGLRCLPKYPFGASSIGWTIVTCYNFLQKYLNFSLKIDFIFTNSAEPHEMSHYVAFHLDLHS